MAMISSVRHAATPFASSDSFFRRSCFSPMLPIIRNSLIARVESFSMHQSTGAVVQRRGVECNTCEAVDRPLEINIELPDEQASARIKIGLYFAMWWALNVVFNIYNKKVLNAFPYPWLTSTLSLAAGSLISLAMRVAEVSKVDLEFWKMLLPVSAGT